MHDGDGTRGAAHRFKEERRGAVRGRDATPEKIAPLLRSMRTRPGRRLEDPAGRQGEEEKKIKILGENWNGGLDLNYEKC